MCIACKARYFLAPAHLSNPFPLPWGGKQASRTSSNCLISGKVPLAPCLLCTLDFLSRASSPAVFCPRLSPPPAHCSDHSWAPAGLQHRARSKEAPGTDKPGLLCSRNSGLVAHLPWTNSPGTRHLLRTLTQIHSSDPRRELTRWIPVNRPLRHTTFSDTNARSRAWSLPDTDMPSL